MINGNPMTDAFTRAAYDRVPVHHQNLLTAVDRFAYGAAFPIETTLGEYAGEKFNKEILVQAVTDMIRLPLTDPAAPVGHIMLERAFRESGLPEAKLEKIITITEEEAMKRINSGAYVRERDGAVRYSEHGHHGRQYIARNSTHRTVAEVLPAPTLGALALTTINQGLKHLGLR